MVHASALSAPVLLVFAAREQARRPFVAHVMLLGVQVVHYLQPDAGQATALGLGAAVLAAARLQQRLRVFWGAASLLAVVPAWLRHDPLPPVALGLAALRRMRGGPAEARPTETALRRAADDRGFTSRCSRLHATPWIRRSAPRHALCPSPIR